MLLVNFQTKTTQNVDTRFEDTYSEKGTWEEEHSKHSNSLHTCRISFAISSNIPTLARKRVILFCDLVVEGISKSCVSTLELASSISKLKLYKKYSSNAYPNFIELRMSLSSFQP
jgi:hypothetical protein